MGGNAGLLLWSELIFSLLRVPMPADPYLLASVAGLSFTSGLVALLIFFTPAHATSLLVVGIAGKGLFALVTLGFHVGDGVSWPWLVFAAWDAAYVAIFWLYLIRLLRPTLMRLNAGEMLAGGNRPRTKRALILYYSLSGNGNRASDEIKGGLEAHGYTCEEERIRPVETELYSFPFHSVWQFGRIMVRAILRRPIAIEPLRVASDHDYDLIVCICQTWMLGMAAPVEAVFLDPKNHGIFAGRDVAIVNICRGLWRRSQAMLADRVATAGGHLVGASAHTNPGWEPARTLSLFIFLGFGEQRRPLWLDGWFLQPQVLSQETLATLRGFGEGLARRPRLADVHASAGARAWEASMLQQEVA